MAAGSLVGKDAFPTIADTLRHKLQVQSGERPLPFYLRNPALVSQARTEWGISVPNTLILLP